MFLYLITNTIDGKRYIGQTKTSLRTRWMCHCKNKSVKNLLANAIRKHGRDNFMIENLLETDDHDLLNEFEKEYIIRYCARKPNGYNILSGGATTAKWAMPEDAKAKIIFAQTGKKHSREWNQNIRAGLIASGQSQKASAFHRGKIVSPETRKRISDGLKAIPRAGSSNPEYWTPERKFEQAQRSRTMWAERRRLGLPEPKNTGRKWTPEQIKQISESNKIARARKVALTGGKLSEEHKRKIAEGMKRARQRSPETWANARRKRRGEQNAI